ncbi:undecaprenyl/decaprenyl-phosphate alpha-N-acetylglucosaminyl 1-phosphate transferase [Echinicola soli]|uniref:Undecaprenyl/decaprenyl-phosphate alpha-N-acetylglucosaminyl 1-phosphate transferase n=1 Tax=Echinicola soli TaxID=2591634 RepID=A0A514CN42_9BACT|nr:MraY family glycosyltransferase [Echinicola soli]QDH81239.1 undecaprenyl/decaprenyl-phosphate alpha-N-acetylglucosaminyl 1-phosphate transferase [Echinicola soli]
MNVLFSFIAAFCMGLAIFPFVIKWIKGSNLMDLPGGRKIHKEAIPSMGGLGILTAFSLSIVFGLSQIPSNRYQYLLISLGILFLIGFLDDWKGLSAFHKLIGQLVAFGLVVVLGEVRLVSFYGFLGVGELPLWISYSLSVFLFVGLTNAYNLVDGLDGLAGTLGLISCSFLGTWFLFTNHVIEGTICFIMTGSLLSFLVYNWHPARIFMGDTGSLPVGFFIAAFLLLFVQFNGKLPDYSPYKFHAPITTGLMLMVVCCYDTLRVIVRRLKRGKSPFSPDKSHVHHFLMRMGYRHDQVTLLLGGIKCVLIILALFLRGGQDILLLPGFTLLIVALGSMLNAITLKKVRIKVRNSPRVLAKSPFTVQKIHKEYKEEVRDDPSFEV